MVNNAQNHKVYKSKHMSYSIGVLKMLYVKYVKSLQKVKKKKDLDRLLAMLPFHDERLQKTNPPLYNIVQKQINKFKPKDELKYSQYVKDYFGLSMREYKELVKQGCQICSSKKRMQVHHIVPKAQGGTDEKSNLQPICFKCHKEIHPWLK